MSKPFWYLVAALMGVGFWAWVGVATVCGIVRTWWRDLTDAGVPNRAPLAMTAEKRAGRGIDNVGESGPW